MRLQDAKEMVMAKALSNMNKAELYAEAQRLRAHKGTRAPKGTSAPKKKVFLNVAGYACKSAWTANFSSNKIVRHLQGACGCEESKGLRCWSVKKGVGTYATRGSDPQARFTPHAA